MFGLPHRETWSHDGVLLELDPRPRVDLLGGAALIGAVLLGLAVIRVVGVPMGVAERPGPPRPTWSLEVRQAETWPGPHPVCDEVWVATPPPAAPADWLPPPVRWAWEVRGLPLALAAWTAGLVFLLRRRVDDRAPVRVRLARGWLAVDGQTFEPGSLREVTVVGDRVAITRADGIRWRSRRLQPVPDRMARLLAGAVDDAPVADPRDRRALERVRAAATALGGRPPSGKVPVGQGSRARSARTR